MIDYITILINLNQNSKLYILIFFSYSKYLVNLQCKYMLYKTYSYIYIY